MKNLTLSLAFVLSMLFAGNVFSQDDSWILAGETDNYKVYINKDSTKTFGEALTSNYNIWLKMECKTECNDGYKSISYSIQNWVLYCNTKEYNVPVIMDYYTDGESNVYKNETATAIIENSPGEKIYNYFCSKPEDPGKK